VVLPVSLVDADSCDDSTVVRSVPADTGVTVILALEPELAP
jgi:hypothetical protein